MLTTLSMAFALVLTFFLTLARVYPIRRILGYGMLLDTGFTLTALGMFHGSLEGMLIATLSGLVMAFTITIARAVLGYDRLTIYRAGTLLPRAHWQAHNPKWFTRPALIWARCKAIITTKPPADPKTTHPCAKDHR
jgi:hypothetical protein